MRGRESEEAPSFGGGEADRRLVVATRPTIFRELLCAALEARGYTISGAVDSEESLTAALESAGAGILVLDYEALGPGGEALIHRVRNAHPDTRVLVLASRSGASTVASVLCAGASGLVGKETGLEMLVRALRAVAAGEIWANRLATAQAFERLASSDGDRSHTRGNLTRREADIVADVLRGLRNKEIAKQLSISEKTVKSHLNNIFRKVGVDNRTALALFAMEQPQLKA